MNPFERVLVVIVVPPTLDLRTAEVVLHRVQRNLFDALLVQVFRQLDGYLLIIVHLLQKVSLLDLKQLVLNLDLLLLCSGQPKKIVKFFVLSKFVLHLDGVSDVLHNFKEDIRLFGLLKVLHFTEGNLKLLTVDVAEVQTILHFGLSN